MSGKGPLSLAEKRSLLVKLLSQKAASTTGWYPLSANQQAMWLVRDVAPESSAYHFALPIHIALGKHGNVWTEFFSLGIAVIFQQLMMRHASLHTIYTVQNGAPRQKVVADLPLRLEQADLRGVVHDEQQTQVIRAYHRPFNLAIEGPMRVCLFRVAENDYILLMVLHHIAADFWSLILLIEDLLALTNAYIRKDRDVPPARVPSFEQYVDWQAQMCTGLSGAQHLAYWHKQLAGADGAARIVTDHPRPPRQSYRGAQLSLHLDDTLVRRLKVLAQRENVTLYMILVAALMVVLRRYTQHDDVVLGSVANCRDHPNFTQLVGFLANAIVLRANVAGDPPFQIFLQQVRQTILDALLHQEYPFLLLVKQLHPKWDLSVTPLFQVLFVLQGFQLVEGVTDKLRDVFSPFQSEARLHHLGVDMTAVHMPQQVGQMDLVVEMFDGGDSCYGFFKYSTDLFEASTILRIMNHFKRVLTHVASRPEQRLSRLIINQSI